MAIAVDRASIGTHTQDNSATTIAIASTTNAVASSGFIVVFVGIADKSVTLSSVSGGSLTWTVNKTHVYPGAGGGFLSCGIASAQAPSGLAAGSTITATLSAGAARTISAMSFTGVATSSPVDTTGQSDDGGAAGTSWATGNVSLAAGSVLVTNAWSDAGDTNSTATTGTEANEAFDPDDNFGHAGFYNIGTSAGNYANAGTWGASSRWITASVAYLAAGGGGTDATVGGVPAIAAGDAPSGVLSAGASVTAAISTALGSAPPANQLISAVVNAPSIIAGASAPVAVVTGDGGGGDAEVTAVPAVAAGSAPIGVLAGDQAVVAVPSVAAGDAPAGAFSVGQTVTAVPAVALADAPRPALSPAPEGSDGGGSVAVTFAEGVS